MRTAEQRHVVFRTGSVVEVFVDDGYQRLTEKRVALPPDLDEFTGEIRRFVVTEHRDPGPARRGVDADDLIGAIQLVQRDVQDDRVDVESALAVERFVGTAETQVQID